MQHLNTKTRATSTTVNHWQSTLHLLLRVRGKRQDTSGFTLIELLVGLIIAVLVMIPLLGLAVNLISTDRREQAKATMEQDLQTAADFIARDLQQAIYIYDSVALTKVRDPNNPANSGIRDQIPPIIGDASQCKAVDKCTPVLAFWTRTLVKNGSPIGTGNNRPDCRQSSNASKCDDTFVYSFVAYYLILGDTNSSVWSNEARIGRFEVSAGVTDSSDVLVPSGQSLSSRDKGYGPFDLSLEGEDIRSKMNRWEGAVNSEVTPPYPRELYDSNSIQILVDNIDATTQGNATGTLPQIACPAPNGNTGESQKGWLQSPYYGYTPTPNPEPVKVDAKFQTYSFYACVNSEQGIAKIFLRGNALSRLQPDRDNFYSENSASLFPTATAEVQLEGKLVQ